MSTSELLALAIGLLPSIIVSIVVGRLNHKIDERDKQREEKEQARIKNEVMIIDLIMTSLSLGEATAEAVQRIPDANCNGDMHDALAKAKATKEKYREFEREQLVKATAN